jgi:hypothetical protein
MAQAIALDNHRIERNAILAKSASQEWLTIVALP